MPCGIVSEMDKIDGLIAHYHYHDEIGAGKSGWVRFILDHYLPFSDHKHQHEKHQDQLPFFNSVTTPYYFLNASGFILVRPLQLNYFNFEFIPSLYHFICGKDLFHPPQQLISA